MSLLDLYNGFIKYKLWYALSIESIRTRFLRSFAGFSWVFISFGLFVLVKVIIFSSISGNNDPNFPAYVTVGFFVWFYVSSIAVDGCSVFVNSKNWIHGVKLPLSLFVYQTVCRNCILAGLNSLIVLAVILYTQPNLHIQSLWNLIFIPLIVFNSIWITLLFALIGARFRDFVHMITSIMRILLFLTPVFWHPHQMGKLWQYLQFNPIAHYLILVREPMLEGKVPLTSLTVVIAITLVSMALSLLSFSYARQRIAFWI
ncbi:ABC transporter permease [Woodsholea maritima]|uniref:ABC transporter permease n=1 Tax=Woodsholea maritima TaxID=240237 RepID=UPI000A054C19